MDKKNKGRERLSRSQAHNPFTRSLNYKSPTVASKPWVYWRTPLMEEVLQENISRDGDQTDCPRCVLRAARLWNRIERDGCLIEDTEEWQRIMRDAAGGMTLHVRPLADGRIVRYYCRTCRLEGYHDRTPSREGGR